MKKIFTGIFTTLAILIFISSIFLMISGTIALNRNQPVYIFGKALAVVPTNSMVGNKADSLDVNDMVIIRRADVEEVKLHDVIVFQGVSNSGAPILVIHRVIDFDVNGIVTKGDHNTNQDQPHNQEYVTSENFQGIYESKITFLKPIAGIMNSSKGIIFGGLALVLTVMLISEVVHLVKTYQDDKNIALKKAHEEELLAIKEKKKKEIREEILNEEKIT